MNNWTWIAIVGGALLILIVLFFIWRANRKYRNNIPDEVLRMFNEAERRYEESGRKKDPYAILWELGRGKRIAETKTRELYAEPSGQEDLQVQRNASVASNQHESSRSSRVDKTDVKPIRRNIFRRS